MRRKLCVVAIAVVLGGVLYGVLATAREVFNLGGHDALVFDGERTGTDWVAQGAAISLVGFVLLIFVRPRARSAREGYLAPIVIGLFWSTFGTVHTLFEIFGVRIENSTARSVLFAYFTPIRLCQEAVGRILLVTSAHRLFWYLPTLGLLFGFASSILAWWCAQAVLAWRNRRLPAG